MPVSVDMTALVIALLSGGGAVSVGAAFKGIRSLRTGARADVRGTLVEARKARTGAEERARAVAEDRDWWMDIAGRYAYQLSRAGLTPDPQHPVPPSERRAGRDAPASKSGRARRERIQQEQLDEDDEEV